MSRAGPGELILGTFLLLFGLSMLLVGGGCTITWLYSLAQTPKMVMLALPMLLISAAVAWIGFVIIRAARRMFRGD